MGQQSFHENYSIVVGLWCVVFFVTFTLESNTLFFVLRSFFKNLSKPHKCTQGRWLLECFHTHKTSVDEKVAPLRSQTCVKHLLMRTKMFLCLTFLRHCWLQILVVCSAHVFELQCMRGVFSLWLYKSAGGGLRFEVKISFMCMCHMFHSQYATQIVEEEIGKRSK